MLLRKVPGGHKRGNIFNICLIRENMNIRFLQNSLRAYWAGIQSAEIEVYSNKCKNAQVYSFLLLKFAGRL
jgi:hypothetical protein